VDKRFWRYAAIAFVCVLAAACKTRNPPLDSAITAHGNTDWHIDTAEEFLFGTDMNGNPSAANHVPASWSRRHMHTGLNTTADFYHDADLIATGDDVDATSGIDTAMLFFYAGHGSPTSWNTLGNNASQGNMSLADFDDGGLLRYYWQCSCEVFAHGPRTCPNASFVYACPGSFDGSADSFDHRNVYERWGPALNDDLRMACGASTDAYCHEDQTNKIWNNYNNNGYDVADSFIDGLNFWGVVPLCITRGGLNVAQTPLYDKSFTNQPNGAGNTFLHIQYLEHFASNVPVLVVEPPELLPILVVGIPPLPDPIRDIDFKEVEGWLVSPEEIEGRGPTLRVHPTSNAVYLRGDLILGLEEPPLDEQEYMDLALDFLRRQGWLGERTFADPEGVRMMLARTPIEGGAEDEQPLQKNVIVTLRRVIDIQGLPVHVLGEGGVMRVQMNNDGTVLNASIVWRDIVEFGEEVPIKTFDEAVAEALRLVVNAENYQLDQWNWGYREEAGNVEQTELRPFFQFTFKTVDPERILEFPPQFIEIPAERQ
jgi:hypothetical protein